ncbi:MAG: hypothetical protein KAU31_12395 [Spirochaetaceae bacterium]|nr:hypothetical protein [Spirochaetaceae bacterium]
MAKEEIRDGKSYHFHYDRAERLGGAENEKPSEAKGLFQRNRSLAIILLDVIIIVIMFLLFQFIFTPGRSWTRVGDYRAELTAFRFESEVYATVEISRVRAGEEQPTGPDSLVVIRFAGREDVLDVLPAAIDGRISATTVFTANEIPDDSPITVELELLGESLTLISTPKE